VADGVADDADALGNQRCLPRWYAVSISVVSGGSMAGP
jgi:hypothetical protein